ncbi:unnamed protein product [Cuscuta epithymum]|uniref:CID domain-containing protein n=2 Tax=Cuscuta epithymum TaxID=186058 RepID=A0AAV0DY47_9ASTE|nr:unnamed protein product [Cuscuta epithymum]
MAQKMFHSNRNPTRLAACFLFGFPAPWSLLIPASVRVTPWLPLIHLFRRRARYFPADPEGAFVKDLSCCLRLDTFALEVMGSTFNPQILVDKLAKLNSSQQSIETLSHWCIFHMNKAKQVVETWERQFHCSPREQRLAFLYLANDILQNSRRKGSEFVGEFWKVLPGALRKVIDSGDEFGRNAALRLIGIWEDRKVFGSRGQILKEEFVGKQGDSSCRIEKPSGFRLRPVGNGLDKVVSCYQVLYGGQLDEDALLTRCRNAINSIEKIDKAIEGDLNSGHIHESGCAHELKEQQEILKDCIEQLITVEASRSNLVSQLRDTLREQECKLDSVRSELQAAQSRSEQAYNIGNRLQNGDDNMLTLGEQGWSSGGPPFPPSQTTHNGEQSAPVMYTRQLEKPALHLEEEDPKSAAAAVAAKLTASTSSAQMLTYVLSSLASEGVIGNQTKDSTCNNYSPAEKRARLEVEYVPNEQPPPPSSPPPPMPPLPPMQPYPPYLENQSAGYSYQQVLPPINGLLPFSAPSGNVFQVYHPSDGTFYAPPQPALPMAHPAAGNKM